MVKIRSFSASDECFTRKDARKLFSPKTPTTSSKFDFSKLKPPIKTQRSVSMSTEHEKVVSFKRHCRKYTINTEIGQQLAKIGDEIGADYAHIFKNFDMRSVQVLLEGNEETGRCTISKKLKISGYLGLLLLHLVSQIWKVQWEKLGKKRRARNKVPKIPKPSVNDITVNNVYIGLAAAIFWSLAEAWQDLIVETIEKSLINIVYERGEIFKEPQFRYQSSWVYMDV